MSVKRQENSDCKTNITDNYCHSHISFFDRRYDYLTLGELYFLHWCFQTIVYPVIGVIGMIVNSISLVLLGKSGLDHSSNVLLFCLTLADMLCLLNALNIPFIMSGPTSWGVWSAPYMEAAFLAGLCLLLFVAGQLGSVTSTYITILITCERMIAIFCPIRFKSLVTPMKVWSTGLSGFIFWCPWVIYMKFKEINFIYGVDSNVTGGIYASESGLHDNVYVTLKMKVYVCFSHIVPFVLVTLGCAIISLKLATARRRRRLLTGVNKKQVSTNRTTKTLLMVCLVYSLMHVALFFNVVLQTMDHINKLYTLSALYNLISNALIYFNSTFNFFFYIAYNNKFRKLLINVIR